MKTTKIEKCSVKKCRCKSNLFFEAMRQKNNSIKVVPLCKTHFFEWASGISVELSKRFSKIIS